MKHEKHRKLTWKMENMESWRNERHPLRALLFSNFFVSCGLVFRAFTIRHNEGGTRKSPSCYRVCGIVFSGFTTKKRQSVARPKPMSEKVLNDARLLLSLVVSVLVSVHVDL